MNSLEELYTLQGILEDFNEDGLPDGIKGKVIIQHNGGIPEKKAAVNIAARLGFETTALDVPLAAVFSGEGSHSTPNINIIVAPDNDKAVIRLGKDGSVHLLAGSDEDAGYGGAYLSSRFPYLWDVGNGFKTLNDVREAVGSILLTEVFIEELRLDTAFEGLDSIVFRVAANAADKPENYPGGIKEALKSFPIRTIILSYGNEREVLDVCGEKAGIEEKPVTESVENAERCLPCAYSGIDLAKAFECGGLVADRDGDHLPDTVMVKIVIPDDADDAETLAACDIAAKLGLSSLGMEFPVVLTESEWAGNRCSAILIGRCCGSYLDEGEQGKAAVQVKSISGKDAVLISGSGEELLRLARLFAKESLGLASIKEKLEGAFSFLTLQGQVAFVDSKLEGMRAENLNGQETSLLLNSQNVEGGCRKRITDYLEKKHGVSISEILPYNSNAAVWAKEYEPVWEVDEFVTLFKTTVLPQLKRGDRVKVFGLLSEEKEIRDRLAVQLSDMVSQYGAVSEEVKIYSAYKQGLSWIMESIVPQLSEMRPEGDIGQISIGFKQFLREGRDDWREVEGDQPSYSAHGDDENKWFELPIRWLQEIYPVDDLIAAELGIDRSKIDFYALAPEDEGTYSVNVRNKNGEGIFNAVYHAKYTERPYLKRFAGIGKVHPSTGWICVSINDNEVINRRIRTDLERIWDIYQDEVLPKCIEHAENKCDGKLSVQAQPFFKELKLEISLSEPDYDLEIRDDRISALDALHEDIYFAALDLFKTLGERQTGQGFAEPGLILPLIEKVNGSRPVMKVVLSDEISERPEFRIGKDRYPVAPVKGASAKAVKLSLKNGKARVCFEMTSASSPEEIERLAASYCSLYNEGIFDDYREYGDLLEGIDIIAGGGSTSVFSMELPASGKRDPKLKDTALSIPCDKVIGYEDYIGLIEKLKEIPGAAVWEAGRSYQDRAIYAVDLTSDNKSEIVSRAKLINAKPTYMIANRHHANEVSSTNSAFLLIEKMLNDKDTREYLKRINLTIMPVENVDGTYIHYMLQEQNPKWKLHIARFNAVGKEFAKDYWEESKYGESKAMPRVWEKWLPDISVDNHGVPTHEWDQQFSGYVSPWFRGFWLPRGIIYGIFYCLTDPQYAHQRTISREVQDYMADKLNTDAEIVRWQLDWKDRFEKYASSWMPKMFQASYYKNLIFYWVDCSRETSKKPSHRYPEISSMDWITEVSDETAQGKYLELCVKAHHMADMAVIELLSQVRPEFLDLSFSKGSLVELKRMRRRPIKTLKC